VSSNPNRAFGWRGRRKGTVLAAGVAAFAVLLTGCGGTRMSDEAIEQAAGVGQGAPLDAPTASDTAPGSGAAGPAVTDPAAGPAVTDPAAGTGAVAPGAAASAGASTTSSAGQGGANGTSASAPVGATKPAAGTAAQPLGPANKPVIRVGVVGTFSGPVGGLVKDTVTGIRVWSQWINARGGVGGHPVEVLIGDDGGDPARFVSMQQQFVEQKGAVAFLYATLGFSPNGNNKYLDSKKIFTLGTEGGLDTVYNNPYVLTATPAGRVNADSILRALGDVAVPVGKTKLANFACSDFGLCDLFDERISNPEALKEVGFELVARGRPSLTQPDYTSQCLTAKQAGAEVVMLELDTASIRRFAGDCARQNYRPIFATSDLLASSSLPSDPNVDGMIIASKMAPWTDQSVPGIAKVTQAFAQYAPGAPPTGGNTNGWILGRFFESIGRNFPAGNVTPADVAAGVYSIKNDNLDGMTFPISVTKGQPMKRQLCYGVVVIKNAKYDRFPGKALRCTAVLPGGPSGQSGAVQSGAVQSGAVQSGAVQAGAARFGMSRLPARAVVSARPVNEPGCPPARVVGLSYLLDVLETGSAAGPSIAFGVALAALGVSTPEPIAEYQRQVITQSAALVEKMGKDGPAAIRQGRVYIEPLAAYNEAPNNLFGALADALDSTADDVGPFIQPGDRSIQELTPVLRGVMADSPAACGPNSANPTGRPAV
jgi:ABC-type branched-subunit amino acid transport system substrate-binding protein